MTLPLSRSARAFAAGCALLFLGAHLPMLASTLEDIDSVNFALGLRHFDVAAHRPHPPGYPVFIAAGKATRTAIASLLPASAAPDTVDARTLALLSALFGALLAFPLLQVYRMLEAHEARARAALVLALASPLLFFNGSRPLSDMAGLAAATAAQALLLTAWRRQRDYARAMTDKHPAAGTHDGLAASGRLIVLGALVAGFAIGVRSQTTWLTLPVLLFVIVDRAGAGAAGAVLGSAITFAIGVLAWGIPLIIASGGPGAYLDALSFQADADLSGVEMLATNAAPRAVAAALAHTVLDPWESWWLAVVVLGCVAVGVVLMLRRSRPALAALAAMILPYAAFHLAFHETITTRYALPFVPIVAYLAARGLEAFGSRMLAFGTTGLAAASLTLTVPPLLAYARTGSPLARAVAETNHQHEGATVPLAMHYAFRAALRDEPLAKDVLPTAPRREWETLAKYWREGGRAPLHFLADPKRTDLAAFDPTSRQLRAQYRWSFDPLRLLGGVRPSDVDVLELSAPGWFVDRGSALTPELAGMSTLDRRGASEGGLSIAVRRRPGPVVIMIGGRNLEKADGPDVRFDVTLDGRPLKAWQVSPRPGFFLEQWTLEPGALDGGGVLATLVVTAEAADGSRRHVEAAVEQFDLQSPPRFVYGFDRGWHEQEYNPATGRTWRWTSDQATVRVTATEAPVVCLIRGESSLRYFDRPSTLTLRAGTVVLEQRQVDADFSWEVVVQPELLRASGGVLTLSTDQTFVPHERTGNGDRRALGTRVYEFGVRAEPAHAR